MEQGIRTFGFGDVVKHRIHGFEGVVIAVVDWVNNCARYTVQPRELKDGKPIDSMSFDVHTLQLVEAIAKRRPLPESRSSARLGDLVEDTLTDLVGTVIGMYYDHNGCVRYYLQPRALHEGKPVDVVPIDDIHILVKSVANPKPKAVSTGGPRQEPRSRTDR